MTPRFKPGDRVVLVSRQPYPPPPEECGRVGTLIEYVTEPQNTAYGLRFGTLGAIFCRVEWDTPLLSISDKMVTRHCMMEVHLDPYQPPKEEPRTEERADYIHPSVRRIFTDPRPVPLREFPAKPEKVKA